MPGAKHLFSLRYFDIDKWPVIGPGDVVMVPDRHPALDGFDHGAQTRVRLDPMFRHPDYAKYEVRHEHQVTQLARFAGEIVPKFIKIEVFAAYVKRDGTAIFLNTKKSHAEAALRRIASAATMGWQRRVVNVRAFHEEFQHSASRAYFGNMKASHLHSVALLGPDVHLSAEFRRNMGRGDLSAISVSLTWDGHLRDVLVSQNNLVMFHMGNEQDAVTFAVFVSDVLAPFAGVALGASDSGESQVATDEDEETDDLASHDL